MKQSTFIFSFLLLAVFFGKMEATEVWVEAKTAYFHPVTDRFYHFYHDGVVYGGEVTVPLVCGFAVFGSVDYFNRVGHSRRGHHVTRIELVPVALGVKYFPPLPIPFLDLYGAVALDWTSVSLHNDSTFATRKSHESAWGARLRGGGVVNLPLGFFVDLFVQYAWSETYLGRGFTNKTYQHNVNISSVSFGLGLGYAFSL